MFAKMHATYSFVPMKRSLFELYIISIVFVLAQTRNGQMRPFVILGYLCTCTWSSVASYIHAYTYTWSSWAIELYTSVLTGHIPKGTVPLGAANVPFGVRLKTTLCPLEFSNHLNYLNLNYKKQSILYYCRILCQ